MTDSHSQVAVGVEVAMYFPTAGIECNPLVPPLVALGVSFFTSMGGISGAFLLLPFQMSFLGYVNPSVSATNQFYNVVAIPSGVYRFIREGRMVWPLTAVVVIGTLPGVFLGALIRVNWLPDPKNFKLFAAAVLCYIGARMLRDLLKPPQAAGGGPAQGKVAEQRFQELMRSYEARRQAGESLSAVRVIEWNSRRVRYEFYGEEFSFPARGVLLLTFIVGIVGGVYGIGGGAIIAPFFVAFFGLPVYTVAGAALMGTFMTSVAGVAFYMIIAPFYPTMSVAPDWTLGLLLGLGGMVGMYLGARCQKHVPARYIKWLLTVILLGTALQYAWQFFK